MDYYFRRLRDLREDHDMNQEQIAKYLGIVRTQYLRYEKGYQAIPVNLLIRLAALYKTSTDYLLGLTDNPKPYDKIL